MVEQNQQAYWMYKYEAERRRAKAASELLLEVIGVLDCHWSTECGGESYNNDDVIEMSDKIKDFLKHNERR